MTAGDRILSIWAYTQVDELDEEGIIGTFDAPRNTWMPLVGADLARVKSLQPLAQSVADKTGRPVRLVHFSVRTEQLTFVPQATRKGEAS